LAELSDKYFREGCKSWDQDLRFILAKSDLAELTKDIAINSGRTKNLIRKTSPDFGLADAIIYETAKQFNASMVTGDRHFKNLENVIFLE
jgi:predicted nucleic acid-binding protein